MLSLRRTSLLSLVLSISLVYADTCSELRDNTDIDVSGPFKLSYLDEQAEYWSASCSALKPSCIIFPKTPAEVAAVIRVLNTNNEKFAVKSGGHSPNNYYASVDGGPLIATQNLDHVILDPSTGIVDIGPGNRLDGVAKKLQGTGWTFVGGRIGNTGVGGLMLGGGLSYMSAQYGWSATSAISYEIVLANGTITTASATSHPDLFTALKGGGNNFGIITSYKLQARRQGQIYGGNLVFLRTPSLDRALLRAVRDFTEHNTDPKAAVIVTAERVNANLLDSWILFLFYDGPTPPQDIFTNFTSLLPVTNTLRTQSYAELMAQSNWVVLKGFQVLIGTETIPLPSSALADEILLDGIHAHWRNMTGGGTLLVPGLVASIAYQPFPKGIAQKARENGGKDLIDVEGDADRVIIEMNYAFLAPGDYERMSGKMEDTYGGIRERVVEWVKGGKLKDVFLPVFMNYGFYRQDYWGRLKPENRALAKSVAEGVDPEGLFRTRTGGWKP